jgi:hypothetical protein
MPVMRVLKWMVKATLKPLENFPSRRLIFPITFNRLGAKRKSVGVGIDHPPNGLR